MDICRDWYKQPKQNHKSHNATGYMAKDSCRNLVVYTSLVFVMAEIKLMIGFYSMLEVNTIGNVKC